MNMIRICAVCAIAFACLVLSCTPSNKELDEAFAGVQALYKGFIKVLDDNKSDPAKAAVEAEKYVSGKQGEINKLADIFKKTEEQILLIKKFNLDLQSSFTNDSMPLKSFYEKNKDVLEKINAQIQKLRTAHQVKE